MPRPCEESSWDMTLRVDGQATEETVGFRNVRIVNGMITGEVHGAPGEPVSELTGTCQPAAPGEPDVSLMTFQFRLGDFVPVGIFLAGWAFLPPGGPFSIFHGRFRAFSADTFTPAALGSHLTSFIPDPGSTGTGNGNQT